MMMLEKNSDAIAGVIDGWLQEDAAGQNGRHQGGPIGASPTMKSATAARLCGATPASLNRALTTNSLRFAVRGVCVGARRAGGRMVRIDFNRLRFLVIDDNAHMRRILRTLLHGFGTREVYEAEDGAAGLEAFTHYMPDIVLADWVMPIFDGLELTQMIRQPGANANPYVPIIMLTGHSEKKRIVSARDAGVTEFLAKPISAKALYERILNVVANPRPFIKTKTYFGPDRRRNVNPNYVGPERRKGGKAEIDPPAAAARQGQGLELTSEEHAPAMAPRKDDTPSVATYADHEVITPPHALRKARCAGTDRSDDPVARAEAALAQLSGEFASWMHSECERLEAARQDVRRQGFTEKTHGRAVPRRPRHQGRSRHLRLSGRRRRRRQPVPADRALRRT